MISALHWHQFSIVLTWEKMFRKTTIKGLFQEALEWKEVYLTFLSLAKSSGCSGESC